MREGRANREREQEAEWRGCDIECLTERDFERRELLIKRMRDPDGFRGDPVRTTTHEKHSSQRDEKRRLTKPVNDRTHASAKRPADRESRCGGGQRVNAVSLNQCR